MHIDLPVQTTINPPHALSRTMTAQLLTEPVGQLAHVNSHLHMLAKEIRDALAKEVGELASSTRHPSFGDEQTMLKRYQMIHVWVLLKSCPEYYSNRVCQSSFFLPDLSSIVDASEREWVQAELLNDLCADHWCPHHNAWTCPPLC